MTIHSVMSLSVPLSNLIHLVSTTREDTNKTHTTPPNDVDNGVVAVVVV